MKTSLFACAAALSLLASTAAFSQVAPRANDQARIRQGVRSGQLTRAEAARAQAQQADARHARQAARADGVVTPAERRVVRHEEKQADRVLYRQKHDGQTRKIR
ncbi:hypothetical protein SAMN02745146_1221 [Hymenobacter daecheongensis DSM 21074]|uniref:DUF4148 domain-containing protein n=1 Tax=Hymenobacter daecheongensis DSM 21074 TaxID=1121955 RepID=A0A1M6CP56_9BACT|nr:hypothetical protein [Hymenobacter daecheongensis]SHI62770.1 hypothetical protein SAMN02745146_1221 [Hymenobacter daecheongensis DSM 21074]